MKIKFLLSLLILPALTIHAQQIDWGKLVPADTNVVVGKLPNGITYYLRHNEEPRERATFFIIRNVGALLENDDQDGLAHFLEHMAFNGSKNFPGNTMISTLERHGISFGGNLNAYTSQNETVYNISDVPTGDESLIDTCLLVLHDWSYYLTLSDEDIDNERGVITEEWRTRNNSRKRISQQTSAVIFKGSQYAKRDVIGELDVIQNFKPQTIRDFYHKWYRTDLEAIAVAGDFDVKMMEEKIKKVFSSIPAIPNAEKRPFFEIPSHEETYFCLATDKEATSTETSLIRLFREPEYDYQGVMTYKDLKNDMMQRFFNSMAASRISELVQSGKAPFVSGGIGFYEWVRGYHAYYVQATAKPNGEKEALEAILQENERILRYGFTAQELARAKANTLSSLESFLKSKDKIHNDQYAEEMQNHFLLNEPFVDTDAYVAASKEVIAAITVEDMLEQARRWWKPDNRTIIIAGPSEGTTHLSEQEARNIITSIENSDITPYEEAEISENLTDASLLPQAVTSIKTLKAFDAEEWTLENGAKVVYRKADYDKDQVLLSAYSPGGYSLIDDVNLLPAATNAGGFASSYGLGKFDQTTLRKMLTGKKAQCSVSIGELYENVAGTSTPRDAETMMQLLYMNFCEPRFDTLAHRVMIDRNLIYVRQMANQPQTVMRDSFLLISSDYNPRTLLFNEDYVKSITIDKVEALYKERIADASDFTFFIVGNIERDSAMLLAREYIGNIPSLHRKEKWIDRKVRAPKGKTVKEISIDMEVPKTTVIITMNYPKKYSVKKSIALDILSDILTMRYLKSIREDQGGTYGVGVGGNAILEPYARYNMTINFDCDPDKANILKPIIYQEIDNIVENGVTTEELDKVVKNMLKESAQEKQHNSYWLEQLEAYYRTGINFDAPENHEKILEEMTTNDIKKFAAEFFKHANVVDLMFVPSGKTVEN